MFCRTWACCGLAVLLTGACASKPSNNPGGSKTNPSNNSGGSKTNPSDSSGPEACKPPPGSTMLEFSLYPGALCIKELDRSVVIRSEEQFAQQVSCSSDAGPPQSSQIDWSAHELFVQSIWYQDTPGRFVGAADSDEGRVVLHYAPPYCNGTPPFEGTIVQGVVLPRRETGEVTLIHCDPELCDWQKNGQGPPA